MASPNRPVCRVWGRFTTCWSLVLVAGAGAGAGAVLMLVLLVKPRQLVKLKATRVHESFSKHQWQHIDGNISLAKILWQSKISVAKYRDGRANILDGMATYLCARSAALRTIRWQVG